MSLLLFNNNNDDDPPSPPSLIVQAVIEFGERTQEGNIIAAVLPAWEEIIRQL